MSNIELSKDCDILMCILYRNYLIKVSDNISKTQARLMGSSDNIQKNLLPNWHKEDVATICWELHSKGLLYCSPGDNIAYNTYITDAGIIYMENRKLNKVNTIIDYISKLKP